MKILESHSEEGAQHLSFTSKNGNSFSLQRSCPNEGVFLKMSMASNVNEDGGRPHINKNEAIELSQVLAEWARSGKLFEEKIVPQKDAEIFIQEFYERSRKCVAFIDSHIYAKSIPKLTPRIQYILNNNPGCNGQEANEVSNAMIVWSMGLSQWSDTNYNIRLEIIPVHAGFDCRLFVDNRMCTDDEENEIKEKTQHMRNAYLWGMENVCKELGMKD